MKNLISVLIFGLTSLLACKAEVFPVPTAKFTFEGKPFIGTAELTNTLVRSNSLFLNGEYSYSAGQDAKPYTAVFWPTVLNYEKFTVLIKVQPEDVSDQKNTLLVGGSSFRWMALSIGDENHLELSFNNHRFHRVIQSVTITNRQWVTLGVSFDLKARKAVVYCNGRRAEEILLPSDFSLAITSDEKWKEYDKVWTFTNYSNGRTFQGLVAGLLAFDTVLSDDQVHRLFPQSSDK